MILNLNYNTFREHNVRHLSSKLNDNMYEIVSFVYPDENWDCFKDPERILNNRRKMRKKILQGSENGNAKLNMEKANHIRALYATKKYYQKDLANMFNVNPDTIYAIVKIKDGYNRY